LHTVLDPLNSHSYKKFKVQYDKKIPNQELGNELSEAKSEHMKIAAFLKL